MTARTPAAPPFDRIPFLDLSGQYRALRAELLEAVTRVLDSGRYILGPEGEAFEAEFARAQGAPRCLGISSGTDALLLALEAAGVGPGHEVIAPAFTFIATTTVVNALGATPVFADVDPRSLTLDAASAAERVTRRTRAIIPVHLYGGPADLDPISRLARSAKLAVIEDCAQAHLTRYRGKPVGTVGDAGCFSFYPSKNLGAAGDAGALTLRRRGLYESCAMLRDVGRKPGKKRYEHPRVGRNCRLDEVQAAVLRVKLRRLAGWTQARRELAERYRRGLARLPVALPPADADGSRHAYHCFTIQTPKRDALARHLSAAKIATAVYYPVPLHLQPAYAGRYRRGEFPVSERAAREVLSLPMYPELPAAAVDRVCEETAAFFASAA
ncbi:MAG: DegT/DnrJ/EryC1/StrS family aminotransferase [Elusimicrobia bacterium]|nr:DegT/DnrJ/EryC1/StrS family aminotransferase [Elusimicrobiota bacterium]